MMITITQKNDKKYIIDNSYEITVIILIVTTITMMIMTTTIILYHTGEQRTKIELYTAFESRYKMPSVKSAEFGDILLPGLWNNTIACAPSIFQSEYNYGNSFYSFEAGLVHFIFINPYTSSDKNSKQYQFLINDFNNIDRDETPWIIVVTHCPFYSSNTAHYKETQTVNMKVQYVLYVLYVCT